MASKTPAKQQRGQSPTPRLITTAPNKKAGYGRLFLVALLGVFLANLTKSLYDAGEVHPVLRRGPFWCRADLAAPLPLLLLVAPQFRSLNPVGQDNCRWIYAKDANGTEDVDIDEVTGIAVIGADERRGTYGFMP